VVNSKTGKKDKRIFHSLGTKDKSIAEIKQLEYDKKYEDKFKVNDKRNSGYNYSILYFLPIGMILGSILVFHYINSANINNKIISGMNPAYSKEKYDQVAQRNEKFSNKINKNENKRKTLKQYNSPDNSQTKTKDLKEIHNIIKTIIPSYKIERMETLSEAFEQAKFFILVASQTSSESLLSICKKITKEHSQFSNIVICLYSDSIVGRQLAQGNEFSIGAKDYKSAWLAMYTYNPVEGEYFDDNPSQHLGAY